MVSARSRVGRCALVQRDSRDSRRARGRARRLILPRDSPEREHGNFNGGGGQRQFLKSAWIEIRRFREWREDRAEQHVIGAVLLGLPNFLDRVTGNPKQKPTWSNRSPESGGRGARREMSARASGGQRDIDARVHQELDSSRIGQLHRGTDHIVKIAGRKIFFTNLHPIERSMGGPHIPLSRPAGDLALDHYSYQLSVFSCQHPAGAVPLERPGPKLQPAG
jgi:hypothetical protein